MAKTYFTLGEARAVLPKAKPLIKRMMELHLKLAVQEEIDISFDEPHEHYVQTIRQAAHWYRTQTEFFEAMERLAKMGIFVKGPDTGLIDFYAKHEGREIFLCYQYPEETIEYWHEVEGGFSGRQSVDLLEPSPEIRDR